jgi:hypothetical protein
VAQMKWIHGRALGCWGEGGSRVLFLARTPKERVEKGLEIFSRDTR